MKTLFAIAALAITGLSAQTATPTKPAPVVSKDIPWSHETSLEMDLIDQKVKEVNDRIKATTDAIDQLKAMLLAQLQPRMNAVMTAECARAGIDLSECSVDPNKKTLKRVPQPPPNQTAKQGEK